MAQAEGGTLGLLCGLVKQRSLQAKGAAALAHLAQLLYGEDCSTDAVQLSDLLPHIQLLLEQHWQSMHSATTGSASTDAPAAAAAAAGSSEHERHPCTFLRRVQGMLSVLSLPEVSLQLPSTDLQQLQQALQLLQSQEPKFSAAYKESRRRPGPQPLHPSQQQQSLHSGTRQLSCPATRKPQNSCSCCMYGRQPHMARQLTSSKFSSMTCCSTGSCCRSTWWRKCRQGM